MDKPVARYKIETSATMIGNLQAPINGAATSLDIVKRGRLVGVKGYVTAVAVDNETVPAPQVHNMECLGRVAINHGNGMYVNSTALTPAWTNVLFKNSINERFDLPVAAGNLPMNLYINPLYVRHPKHTDAAPKYYTNVTVAISVVFEIEED
jgi:hypothetical protein